MTSREHSSDAASRTYSTPYVNGRATMRGVFKAYVVFLYYTAGLLAEIMIFIK